MTDRAVALPRKALAGSVAGKALAITYAVLQTMLVALPSAARLYEQEHAGAEAILRQTAAWCAVAVVPLCALVVLAAPPLLAAGLGDAYRDAAGPLRIALAAAALAPACALTTQLAALRARPGAALAGALVGAATFAVVAALAVSPLGADGAALAMLAGVATTSAATFVALRAPS